MKGAHHMSRIISRPSNKPSNLKTVVETNDGKQYMVSTVPMAFPLGRDGYESMVFSYDPKTGKIKNYSNRYCASAKDSEAAYHNHSLLCSRLEDVLTARLFL